MRGWWGGGGGGDLEAVSSLGHEDIHELIHSARPGIALVTHVVLLGYGSCRGRYCIFH